MPMNDALVQQTSYKSGDLLKSVKQARKEIIGEFSGNSEETNQIISNQIIIHNLNEGFEENTCEGWI